jgi:hypothetical protein
LVENLTLSKMTVQFDLPADMPISDSLSLFEGALGTRERAVSLKVSYRMGGLAVSPNARLNLRHAGRFQCSVCDRPAKKLFDSFCYPCLQKSAQADRCLLNPVGCHFMAGTCREPQWGQEFCYQPHYVYLAYTDKYKVGITRRHQVPVRWIDQGATMSVLLAEVGSRHQAGQLEDFLSGKFADKSHWLKMLKAGNQRPEFSGFEAVRREALQMLEDGLAQDNSGRLRVASPEFAPHANSVRLLPDALIVALEFPLWNDIPEKIVSLNLDKTPQLESSIRGIKGQYLFLEHGVLNVRRHEGYVVDCEILNVHGQGCAK